MGKCRVHLLSDLPAESDAFGPHGRIARAIANLIREEEGGKTIALTGSWGSGKSTVVQILKNLLSKKDNSKDESDVEVFIYDAWSHQGDPLRRSFLEELVQFLMRNFGIDKNIWEKEIKKRIRKYEEETESTSTPILTWPGRFLAFLTLFLPLGYTLFSQYKTQPESKVFGLSLWCVGLFIVLCPIIFILLTWICWRPWTPCRPLTALLKRIFTKDFWLKHRHPHEDESLVSFFIQKTRIKNESKTIRTPEPTSIEFKEIFEKSLNEAFNKAKKKLLIVIDNLDRIPTQEALSVWSTMRTFFETGTQENQNWISNFWLLVPFDPGALYRLWPETTDKADLANAFKDKTFQVTFHVPPPVLSDWKEFFQKQFSEAFPNHSEEDFHKIYRLFSIKGIPEDRPLTPRDIKLFINRLVALHLKWDCNIPLPLQALYVLNQDKISKSPNIITDKEFIRDNTRLIDIVDDREWQKYLSALHFNVEPIKAIQVLIENDVSKTLKEGNIEKISKYQDIPGFLEVCEKIIEQEHEDWSLKSPDYLANAALVINSIQPSLTYSWKQIWNWICQGILMVGKWRKLDENIGKGIVIILKYCPPNEYEKYIEKILAGITNPIHETKEEQDEEIEEKIKNWINGVLVIIKPIHERGYGELIKNKFRVSGDAELYINVLSLLSNKTKENEDKKLKELIHYFQPECKPQEVIQYLLNICNEGNFNYTHAKTIEIMTQIDSDWPWQGLTKTLNSRLQGNNNLQPHEIGACVESMILLAFKNVDPVALDRLKTLATHGHLAHHLYNSFQAKDFRSVSLCMFPIFEFVTEGNLQNNIGNSSAGIGNYNSIFQNPNGYPEIINNFAENLFNFKKVDILFDKISNNAAREFISAVLKHFLENREDYHLYIKPSHILETYSELSKILQKKLLEELIEKLIEKSDFIQVIEKHGFSIDLAELYLIVYRKSKTQKPTSFVEFLTTGLRNVDKEEWLQEITEEGELLDLLLELSKDEFSINLTIDFQDALIEHVKNLLDGEELPVKYIDNWNSILDALKDDSRETFLRTLRDELIKHSSKEIYPILKLYGEVLLESTVLEEKADEVVRLLFTEVINKKIHEELSWLIEALKKKQEILEKCPESSKNVFIERIKKILEEIDVEDELAEIFQNIARIVGLNPEEYMTKNDASEEDTDEHEESS